MSQKAIKFKKDNPTLNYKKMKTTKKIKKAALLLMCLPLLGLAQQTYVPGDSLEQALINLGYDNVLDDYVTTANINTIQYLNVSGQFIADLTGIFPMSMVLTDPVRERLEEIRIN